MIKNNYSVAPYVTIMLKTEECCNIYVCYIFCITKESLNLSSLIYNNKIGEFEEINK